MTRNLKPLLPRLPAALTVVVMALITTCSWAQTYRCEANGAVTYQATPCAGGKVVSAPVNTPTAAEVKDAQSTNARQEKTADDLQQSRIARDKANPPKDAMGITVRSAQDTDDSLDHKAKSKQRKKSTAEQQYASNDAAGGKPKSKRGKKTKKSEAPSGRSTLKKVSSS
jgi:hypothetical protein